MEMVKIKEETIIKQEEDFENYQATSWNDVYQFENDLEFKVTDKDLDALHGSPTTTPISLEPICTYVTYDKKAGGSKRRQNCKPIQSIIPAVQIKTDGNENGFEKEIMLTPTLLTQYTGLKDLMVFYDLLYNIEDQLVDIEGATKFEQLFTVLTKLHLDKDAYRFDEFKFPAVYVTIIDILYERSRGLFKTYPREPILIPEFLTGVVNKKASKTAIIDILKVYARSNAKTSTQIKYLIGYTLSGQVFYLSRAFPGSCAFWYLVQKSGILQTLGRNAYFMYKFGRHYYSTSVKKFEIMDDESHSGTRLTDVQAQEYLNVVISNIKVRFKVLTEEFPMYMLRYELDGECFIHKLVYTCCYLLGLKL